VVLHPGKPGIMGSEPIRPRLKSGSVVQSQTHELVVHLFLLVLPRMLIDECKGLWPRGMVQLRAWW
jgi:hypothetical protein